MDMKENEFPIGQRVTLPGHFPEPVILEAVRPIGGGYECRVRLPDGTPDEAIRRQARDVDTYLLRTLLAGAFGGTPDQLIDDLVAKLTQLQGFDVKETFGVIRSKGRSLELTEDRFWQMGYGSETIHLLFNLWYRDFNYTPAYENNLPQVDHVFPQSLLRKVKTENPETGRKDLTKFKEGQRDQLANCMLLTAEENGAGGKWDKPPHEWFSDKPDKYLEMHLIPKNPDLWRLERFEDFVAERKKLIRAKFVDLLVGEVPGGEKHVSG